MLVLSGKCLVVERSESGYDLFVMSCMLCMLFCAFSSFIDDIGEGHE